MIGAYRFIAAGCAPGYGEPMWSWSPIVAIRERDQPQMGCLPACRVFQVLTKVLGEYMWINVAREDVALLPSPDSPSVPHQPWENILKGRNHVGPKQENCGVGSPA